MVRLQSVEAKRQREKRMVQEMVALYCRKKHGGQKRLCPECAALAEYAGQRSDRWRQKPSAPTAAYTATVLI